ncbi:N-formylglutamate amidohydrolase [Deinococcus radiopugnans]|uniref:N-formylglutamate amidohydrolase n=1 Tax=Deinococcus radiopugnans TaxID=57497 RepID=A0A0A7KEE7_9DEIO|nr:N-formylglutamate amidohydrolase [Deinococcus radiopugnans]AIZ44521.1 N-formylglutamate amidohydrolase [Deinococcus radiopugnans]
MSRSDRDALLIVTPHPSGQLPADILRQMLGDDVFDTPKREAFLRRIFLDGDAYTDLLYSLPGARHVQAPWSRFAVDLNRERGDRVDNGVIKDTDFDRQPLYPPHTRLSDDEREARLRHIWDPFDAAVGAELSGARLMIVGHSMASHGPRLGQDTGTPRPAICLMPGTPDAPTFPHRQWHALQGAAEDAFGDVIAASPFERVTIGEPWSTDTLSLTHSRRSGVPAFGIEFNVGLHLRDGQPRDDVMRQMNAAFARFADAALELVN